MSSSALWIGYGGLVETPKSGAWSFKERVTYSQEFEGSISDAATFAVAHARGTIWTISGFSGFFISDGAETAPGPETGSKATVTVTYCWTGVVPPDEWSLTAFKVDPAIERHPFFSALSQDDLKKAKASFNAATAAGQSSVDYRIGTLSTATLIQSLINKWLLGEETYYLAGLTFQYSVYSYTGPTGLSTGGDRESPSGPFAGYIPSGFSWLRQADEPLWSNGLFKVTYTWLGAPSGHWDSDIYP